ncbi:leucine-rich repeat domain-containing protein [Butyrivibrio sp. AC2005]|uniref:leucine-rich repeat domain-containing protein n=1 Tax=Butyrivibrio sp. AC2005 TaxID=1280672 RepID=UPI00040909B2|nr:leucine-rich repeat domain-containing protein [Butyrivibrio sp. AC2005]
MNKRILALGLAGALAMTSVVIPCSPTSLSVEAAYVVTSVSLEEKSLTFPKIVSTTSGEEKYENCAFAVGEKRTAVVSGKVITMTTNNLSDDRVVYYDMRDDKFVDEPNQDTISVYHVKLSDLTNWRSDTESVATVENGVVTAKDVGRALIEADFTYKDENNEDVPVTFSQTVVVTDRIPGDELISEEVDLTIGDSYTINPTFFKSTIDKGTIDYDIYDVEFGDDYKWDDNHEVITGSVATFNTKTGILNVKDIGYIEIDVWAKNTTDGRWYQAEYTFIIGPAIGATVKDWDNTGKYTILNTKEVAFAGQLNGNSKLVIPGRIYIKNKYYDVVEIADGALEGSNIKSVLIPDSVRKIGTRAFKKCKKLKRVDLSSTDVTEIGDEAFSDCDKLKEVILDADKITKIGKKAFKGKKKGRKYYIVSSKKKVHKKFVKKLKKAKAKGQFLEQNMAEPEAFEVEQDERR